MTTGTVLEIKTRRGDSCDTTQKVLDASVQRFDFNDEYLSRLRNDDPESWRHFYAYFRPKVQAKLRAQFLWDLADELTSDTMAAAFEKIKQGEPKDPGCLAKYVLQICHNKSLESIRKLKGDRTVQDIDWEQFQGTGKNPQQQWISTRQNEQIDRVMGKLSKRDRDVLLAIYYDGKDRNEVCSDYEITRDQLKMILFHARQRFLREWKGP